MCSKFLTYAIINLFTLLNVNKANFGIQVY
jgi:hypothetical protein